MAYSFTRPWQVLVGACAAANEQMLKQGYHAQIAEGILDLSALLGWPLHDNRESARALWLCLQHGP